MRDKWILILILIILTACYEAGHVDIPDKAETVLIKDTIVPKLGIVIPKVSIEPKVDKDLVIGKSACEYEVDDLKADLESKNEIIRGFECICGGDYD